MRRFALLVSLSVACSPAICGEAVIGADIEAMLNDTTVWYLPLGLSSARQFFDHNGDTPYIDVGGSKTSGRWLVRGDQYCSQWPPSDQYRCYGVEKTTATDGMSTITFVSGSSRYEGVLKSGKHIDEPWGG